MSMWFGLPGPVQFATGTSGTVTLVAGSKVLQIKAFAATSGSIDMFGTTIVLPASSGWFELQENHALNVAPTGASTIVFASTASYYVEYMPPAVGF